MIPPIEDRILFEDNHFIAINKYSSEIVQGDKTGDQPLSETVKLFLKKKYNKPGNVFCGVIHRIDRPVSGVLLLAKTSKGLARMNAQFSSREVKKIYWAIVKNQPKELTGNLVHYLVKDEKKNMSKAFEKETKNAKRSELNYTVIAKGDNYSLLEIDPLTGRHHQIRVQLSKIGSPIKGDLKYGAQRSNPDGSVSLHARKLIFNHPISNERIEIIAPVPNEKIWQDLSQSLSQ